MTTWVESVTEIRQRLTYLPSLVARSAEYAHLAGEDARREYRNALTMLGHIIKQAKETHAELSGLSTHQHEWNDNDYCDLCGADGRA
jgi:hypothetical protein